MQMFSAHMPFQLLNELTRVKYLLDVIKKSDAELHAAMANVRQDTKPDGKMNDFEDAAASIIPSDPVLRK